jgi:hypothetical protein
MLIVSVIDGGIFLALLYFMFSMSEYLVHRYVMHSAKSDYNIIANDHWNHHEHTTETMELRTSDKYNAIENKYMGLYFTWSYTIMVFVVGLAEGALLAMVLQGSNIYISGGFVVSSVVLFSGYQSSFWNTLHPEIHGIVENISLYDGIPGWHGWKRMFSMVYIDGDLTLYQWFIRNHTLHHLRKGVNKGNYNVTLPGADWIFAQQYSVR